MLTIAPASPGAQALDWLRTPAGRVRTIERDTTAYLARLLEVNSTRLQNDFLQRLGDSRAQLEQSLRTWLRDLSASAQRTLEQASTAHAKGAEAASARVHALTQLRQEVDHLVSPAGSFAVPGGVIQGRIGAPVTGADAGAPLDAGHGRTAS